MLYLEDYIELIEQLPQDLRDRFTEMRELDLKVQNNIDTLDTRVRRFFTDARKNKPENLDEDYKSIHSSYKLALEDADEKVSMASEIYDLVERHLRKLDQELSKFKMELEADCSGITEVLERRSMMYDESTSLDALYNNTYNHNDTNHKRKFGDFDRMTTNLTNGVTDSKFSGSSTYTPLGAAYPLTPSPNVSTEVSNSSRNVPSSIGKAASSSTSATSVKAVNNTTSKEQGRVAQASLKAISAAQKKAEQLGNSLSLSGLLGSTTNSIPKPAASLPEVPTCSSYHSTSLTSISGSAHASSTLTQKQNSALHGSRQQKAGRRGNKTIATHSHSASSSSSQQQNAYPEPALDWVPDPNEPTYCLCNQVSYGEMVGCDNPSCPIEWFHYGCVGLTDAPKGKWYCPDCTAQIKKRRAR